MGIDYCAPFLTYALALIPLWERGYRLVSSHLPGKLLCVGLGFVLDL